MMLDREKVIRGLECHQIDKDHRINCSDCPYHCDEFMNGLNELHNDALALLKEQEEMKPKQVELYGKDEWWGLVCVCPDCKAEWMSDKADTHFCPKCGQAVKWE